MKYIFLILISTQSFAQNLSQVDKTFLPVVKEFISAAKIDRVPKIRLLLIRNFGLTNLFQIT
jgi:hypothetical protein